MATTFWSNMKRIIYNFNMARSLTLWLILVGGAYEDGGTWQFALWWYIKICLLYIIILFYYLLADPVHFVAH